VRRRICGETGAGSVHMQGGAQDRIHLRNHRKAYTSSEQEARREFESYRVSASVKGDTAWIVAEAGDGIAVCRRFCHQCAAQLDSARSTRAVAASTPRELPGRVDIGSGGGNLRLDDIGGVLSAENRRGTIDSARSEAMSVCIPAEATSRSHPPTRD